VGAARYDKYGPLTGGFRAPSNIAWAYVAPVAGVEQAGNDVGKVWAVGLNSSGRVVKGAGVTGIIGVFVPTQAQAAGDIIDVMTSGEIANFTLQNQSAAAAGTRYFGVAADGTFSTTATGTPLGFTVEATRLVVRLDRATTPTT
jgi:hypothetical protein